MFIFGFGLGFAIAAVIAYMIAPDLQKQALAVERQVKISVHLALLQMEREIATGKADAAAVIAKIRTIL